MRRVPSVKSQEELQSDISCLKRQLALALDENQLLKVKIRRLEDELRRKDKYIESVRADPERSSRFLHDQSGAKLINKLQRRNQELEAMILERDLQDEKRCKDLKTMSLYSHNMNCQASRKGTKSSMQNLAQLNFRPRSNSPSRRLLTKHSNGSKFDSVLSIDHSTKKRNCYSSRSSDDCPNIEWGLDDESEMNNVPKSVESEKIMREQLLRIKDAEISRLSAELKDIKNLLEKQERQSSRNSMTTTQIRKSSHQLDRDVNSVVHTNFVEKNKTYTRSLLSKPNDRKFFRTSNECPKNEYQTNNNKLETLDEHNEEIFDSNNSLETNSVDPNSKRPKTRIEYVYDSEVSSDGEEFSLPSNLTSFLQQAVNTSPNDQKDDVYSD